MLELSLISCQIIFSRMLNPKRKPKIKGHLLYNSLPHVWRELKKDNEIKGVYKKKSCVNFMDGVLCDAPLGCFTKSDFWQTY